MKAAESQTPKDEQANAHSDAAGNTDTTEQLARIEARLTRLAQAVIAAHARIDAHADETLEACKTATVDVLTKLSERTLPHIDEGFDRVSACVLQAKTDTCESVSNAGALMSKQMQTTNDAVQARLAYIADQIKLLESSASAAKRSSDVRNRLVTAENTVAHRLNELDTQLARLGVDSRLEAETTRNHVDAWLRQADALGQKWWRAILIVQGVLVLLELLTLLMLAGSNGLGPG